MDSVKTTIDSVKVTLESFSWLKTEFFGNSLQTYLFGLVFILLGMAFIWILDKIVIRAMRRVARHTTSTLDDFLISTIERFTLPALQAVVIYTGLRDIVLKPSLSKGLLALVTVFVTVQAVRLLTTVLQELLERHMARHADSSATAEMEKKSVWGVLIFVKLILWTLAFVLVLDNLGFKVSTFVAGLGITGIAVALAAQAILGDLFSYFVIFFDRPFQVGHFIKIGDFMGTVENIGIKTTRIRSLSGEVIVMSNKYLTDNQVQNYRLMQRRRAVTSFEVEYGTPNSQLEEIPGIVRGILEGIGGLTFDRCHFNVFGDSGLKFELVFYVEVPEYNAYMDILQKFNLALKDAMEARKVGFAFPTRTVHLIQGE